MPAGSCRRIVLAAACLAAPIVAHAEFQDDYAAGLKALDAGRYADARRYLQRALAAQSEPVDKVILNGSIEQPYLPYHFLGLVAYQLGECDTARAQWNNPNNRRMTARLNPIRQQEQRLEASCTPKKTAEAPAEEKSTIAQVPETPAEPAAVAPLATPAEKPASKATPGGRSGAKSADETATSAKPAGSDKTAAADKAAAAQKPVAAAEKAGDKEKPPEAAAGEHVPPPRLVRAVDSYLAGRYAEAARLDPEALPPVRARFHAYLLRAAARYDQAMLSGDKNLLAAARSDAAAAFRLDGATAPDEALFSPKFRAFYTQAH